MRGAVAARLEPVGKKVRAIVNYDSIAPALLDQYVAMVNGLTERYYSRVTPDARGTFMRACFGEAFRRS